MDIWAYNRWFSLIGNVLNGDTIYKTRSTDAMKFSRWDGYCFRLGYGFREPGSREPQRGGCGLSNQADNPMVASSAMLWGNYCAAGASTRWIASEVPTPIQSPQPGPGEPDAPGLVLLFGPALLVAGLETVAGHRSGRNRWLGTVRSRLYHPCPGLLHSGGWKYREL